MYIAWCILIYLIPSLTLLSSPTAFIAGILVENPILLTAWRNILPNDFEPISTWWNDIFQWKLNFGSLQIENTN